MAVVLTTTLPSSTLSLNIFFHLCTAYSLIFLNHCHPIIFSFSFFFPPIHPSFSHPTRPFSHHIVSVVVLHHKSHALFNIHCTDVPTTLFFTFLHFSCILFIIHLILISLPWRLLYCYMCSCASLIACLHLYLLDVLLCTLLCVYISNSLPAKLMIW